MPEKKKHSIQSEAYEYIKKKIMMCELDGVGLDEHPNLKNRPDVADGKPGNDDSPFRQHGGQTLLLQAADRLPHRRTGTAQLLFTFTNGFRMLAKWGNFI